MKKKNVIALSILIICIIGCGKVNIKETNISKSIAKEISIEKTNVKETVVKNTSSSANNPAKNSSKKTNTRSKKNNNEQSVPYEEIGIASFISDKYDGKMTASGVRYNRNKMTAAHPFLPFDTKVLITNLRNKKTAEVIIVDRFHPTKDRILNVSYKAAMELDLIESGIAKISIKVIGNPDQVSN